MTPEEVTQARQLIAGLKLDHRKPPACSVPISAGDLRMLIYYLERALRVLGDRQRSCSFELGEDWG